jgi:hypothetical protein
MSLQAPTLVVTVAMAAVAATPGEVPAATAAAVAGTEAAVVAMAAAVAGVAAAVAGAQWSQRCWLADGAMPVGRRGVG